MGHRLSILRSASRGDACLIPSPICFFPPACPKGSPKQRVDISTHQPMGQQQSTPAPAQRTPEAIGSQIGRAEGIGKGIEKPLTQSQMLTTTPFRSTGNRFSRGVRHRPSTQRQKGLKVVEKPGGGLRPWGSTSTPAAGGHLTTVCSSTPIVPRQDGAPCGATIDEQPPLA